MTSTPVMTHPSWLAVKSILTAIQQEDHSKDGQYVVPAPRLTS